MAHWRNTYRPARFFFLDVRVGVIILASLIHLRWYTFTLDVIAIALGWYVERIGLGFAGAVRAFREYFAGAYRPALPKHKIRGLVDYSPRQMAWVKKKSQETVQLKPIKASKL